MVMESSLLGVIKYEKVHKYLVMICLQYIYTEFPRANL
jgi:hypothetical protein